ncbi:MAG: 50S ribosomal protein L35ae [Candidatus Woesearchaeota archaeon]|jgi:ribosomal protein L35AE/L33A
MAEGTVLHYRQGRHHQNTKQNIIKVAEDAEGAQKMVGKTATWTTPAGKVIKGKITQLHGKKGNVRVLFTEKGLPGQALGQKVKVE